MSEPSRYASAGSIDLNAIRANLDEEGEGDEVHFDGVDVADLESDNNDIGLADDDDDDGVEVSDQGSWQGEGAGEDYTAQLQADGSRGDESTGPVSDEGELYKGKTFASSAEMVDFCHAYARQRGFEIRIRNSIYKNSPAGSDDDNPRKCVKLRLECCKAGKAKASTKLVGSRTVRTGCQFAVNGYPSDGMWMIGEVNKTHNHECKPENSRFLSNYTEFSETAKRRLSVNDRAGVPVSKNYNSAVVDHGNYESIPFGKRAARNWIGRNRTGGGLRLGRGDFDRMRKTFDELDESGSNFFYRFDLDNDSRLRNVFWADGRSRAAYIEFGDVLSFDTTYISNRYKMPFAPFVGINHHGQSIQFGCALLGGETEDDFVWLFRTWLTCMSNKAPRGIITDQCMAMSTLFSFVCNVD